MASAIFSDSYSGGKYMKNITEKDRKELEAKLEEVFRGKISQLSTELRQILLDDMVTAFENRMNVLNRVGQRNYN